MLARLDTDAEETAQTEENQLVSLTSSLCGWCNKNESDGATTNSGTRLCDDCAYELSDDNKDCGI